MANDRKAEARDRNLPWSMVREAFLTILAEEQAKIEHPRQIRRDAWMMHTATTPSCWPFWWTGFRNRFGRRLAQGCDYTIIPGYDTIGQQIGSWYPEWQNNTEGLWEFLLSDYERTPGRDTIYKQAMDRVEFETTSAWPTGDTFSTFPDRGDF